MKEVVVIEVKDGNVLNFAIGSTPAGQPVTIPPGVTSLTLLVRDTEGYEQAKAKKADRIRDRRRKKKRSGRRGKADAA